MKVLFNVAPFKAISKITLLIFLTLPLLPSVWVVVSTCQRLTLSEPYGWLATSLLPLPLELVRLPLQEL